MLTLLLLSCKSYEESMHEDGYYNITAGGTFDCPAGYPDLDESFRATRHEEVYDIGYCCNTVLIPIYNASLKMTALSPITTCERFTRLHVH